MVQEAQRPARVDQLVAVRDPEPFEEPGQERVQQHDPGVVDEQPAGSGLSVDGGRVRVPGASATAARPRASRRGCCPAMSTRPRPGARGQRAPQARRAPRRPPEGTGRPLGVAGRGGFRRGLHSLADERRARGPTPGERSSAAATSATEAATSGESAASTRRTNRG